MNRHTRKRFYRELDAYLAFFAEVRRPSVVCYSKESLANRIAEYTNSKRRTK